MSTFKRLCDKILIEKKDVITQWDALKQVRKPLPRQKGGPMKVKTTYNKKDKSWKKNLQESI